MENKDIISILCVEDGSVDIQNIEENGLQDCNVLVYRQGSRPPFVLQLPRNNQQLKAQQTQLAIEKLEDLLSKIYGSKCEEINLTLYIKWDDFLTEINEMINELKGGAE